MPAVDRSLIEVPGDVLPRPHVNCYWLIAGMMLAGEHPGSTSHASCVARMDALLDAGVGAVIDLTDEGEGAGSYVQVLDDRARVRQHSVAHRRYPIPDFGVPSPASMRNILDAIYRALDARALVYLHCWGGVGRTGTVVGCLLREQGFTHDEALDRIARKWDVMQKRARHPHSPETPAQVAFIKRWREA